MSSYKKLLKVHENTLKWLREHNEENHQQKNIDRREKELERLKNNPF